MRLTAALGLWWPEAYGGSASCSDVPRLLLGIARSAGGHDEALLEIVKAFAWDCQVLCVLDACRGLCSGARGMTRLFSFSPLELFSGSLY
jgi:hypothetical protein